MLNRYKIYSYLLIDWVFIDCQVNNSFCVSPSFAVCAERLVERTVLFRPVQGHEPYAVYRVRTPGPGEHVWYLAHYAQHDRGSHLLRHVHRPRHRPHPVLGLLTPPVPRKSEYGQEHHAPSFHEGSINSSLIQWGSNDISDLFFRFMMGFNFNVQILHPTCI